MKILFSVHIRNHQEANTCITILNMLIRGGDKLEVLLRKNKYSQLIENQALNCIESNDFEQGHYDLILTYNTTGNKRLKAWATCKGVPVVCMMDTHTVARECPIDQKHLSKIVFFHPSTNNFPAVLFQQDFVFPWQVPIALPNFIQYRITNPNNPRILVIISHQNIFFSPLFQIVPFLNKLLNFDIKVVTDTKVLSKILNPNIKVITKKGADIDQLITEADIVVGSGDGALKAIALGKPVIVAGERGYGGLINGETFLLQYQNHFQGRIGGGLGELIPEKLLMDNVFDLLEWESELINKILQENWQLLKIESTKQEKVFISFLRETIKTHEQLKTGLWSMKLKLSRYWQLLPLTQEKFILKNIRTGHVHSHFEKEEAEIIQIFGKGIEVKKALKASGYEEEPELFTEFVQDLAQEKILVAHES